jgi:hypothetical protein
MTLRTIHAAAEPHTTNTKSGRREAQEFQKCSRAGRNRERRLASQGSSSRKTTRFRRRLLRVSRYARRRLNASTQFCGGSCSRPEACARASAKFLNWSAIRASCTPVSSKQRSLRKCSRIKNVLPTRLRPYTATNSASVDETARSRMALSRVLPTSPVTVEL